MTKFVSLTDAMNRYAEEQGFTLPQRTLRSIAETDAMSPALRACVHEFGYAIVKHLMLNGMTDPIAIRATVFTIWDGARQPLQSSSGSGVGPEGMLDWVLAQSGSRLSTRGLLRLIHMKGWTLVPVEPSDAMVTASMETVSGGNVPMTKGHKHKLRLRAAIRQARDQFWPSVAA